MVNSICFTFSEGGYSDQKRRVPSLPSFNAPSVERNHVAVIWYFVEGYLCDGKCVHIHVHVHTRVIMCFPVPAILSFRIMHMHTYDTVFWFFLGQLPNVVGLTFGVIQIVLYAMYRNNKTPKDEKLPEHKGDVDNNENVAPTVSGENQELEVNPHAGDIEIGEKKEEQVAEEKHDKTESNNNNNNNVNINNKTEEKEGCEI